MTVGNNVPEIRFNGFSRAWEERSLDSVYRKIRNAFVGTATPYYVKEGHFYLESNNIKDGKINRRTEIFINDEFYHKQSDKWLREGDIVMVQSGHVGHTAVIPPELNNIAAHALIMFTDPKEDVSPYFLNFQFQTENMKTKLSEITTGNTIKHILSSEMKAFEMLFTDFEEQTQIGNTFQKLDSLINQHQQKHDKLSHLKKAMLEKMFPKQGETVPEIRFKGFSGEWLSSSIGEICGATFGGGTPSTNEKNFWQGEIPWIQSSDVKDGVICSVTAKKYITKAAVNKTATKLVSGNSIAIVTRVGVGKLSLMRGEYSTSQDFLSLSDLKINSQYAVYVIWKQLKIEKEQVQGTSIKGITKDELLGKFISYPESEEEQTQIGNYFQKLDTLINQHQQQITKLTNIKQACLSKMFV
ncbi:restriction endonuclease subunit S [Vibrio splendidus]